MQLSLLIPARDYPLGVERILRQLAATPSQHASDENRVEILVSDDSTDDRVGAVVERWRAAIPSLRYWRNHPPLGAARNWNWLLEQACGRYCLLLHHDELPFTPGFVQQVLDEITSADYPDIIMMRCAIVTGPDGKNREHVPVWVRNAWLGRGASLVLLRNVIGPMSTLVVKRESYPRFDEQLRWLVDVEAYYRLLATNRRVHQSQGMVVASVLSNPVSITSSLRGKVRSLAREERRYILAKHGAATAVKAVLGRPLRARLTRGLESVCWTAARSIHLTVSRVAGSAVDPARIRALLQDEPQGGGASP